MALSPREYVEHQLNMSDEEKQARQEFFTALFADHDATRATEMEMEVEVDLVN